MSDELKLEDFLPYRLAVLSNTVSTTVANAYARRFGVSRVKAARQPGSGCPAFGPSA